MWRRSKYKSASSVFKRWVLVKVRTLIVFDDVADFVDIACRYQLGTMLA